MAYNTGIYGGYGYGTSYAQQMPQQQIAMPQQAQAGASQADYMGIIWVDGEIDAKARQIPSWWPVNKPLPLWDTNDTVIYVKSINQYGMPNPIQRIRYQMEEATPKYMGQPSGTEKLTSGETETDMTRYVRKEELEQMKDDLMRTIQESTATTTVRTGKNVAKGE